MNEVQRVDFDHARFDMFDAIAAMLEVHELLIGRKIDGYRWGARERTAGTAAEFFRSLGFESHVLEGSYEELAEFLREAPAALCFLQTGGEPRFACVTKADDAGVRIRTVGGHVEQVARGDFEGSWTGECISAASDESHMRSLRRFFGIGSAKDRLAAEVWRARATVAGRVERGLQGAATLIDKGTRAFHQWRFRSLEFTPRRDDVFIVTYPKSGTTLLQMMLYQLLTDGSMDFGHINHRIPYFDLGGDHDPINPQRIHTMHSPRCFKTHLTFRELPKRARFIYVVRNPLDVAASAYRHAVPDGSTMPEGELDVFIEGGALGRISWYQHFEQCFPMRHQANVLFLTYEDLREDLGRAVRQVADFLGVELSEDHFERVLHHCDISFMRQFTDQLDPAAFDGRPRNPNHVGAGLRGGWRVQLPESAGKRFQLRFAESLIKLGIGWDDPDLGFLAPTGWLGGEYADGGESARPTSAPPPFGFRSEPASESEPVVNRQPSFRPSFAPEYDGPMSVRPSSIPASHPSGSLLAASINPPPLPPSEPPSAVQENLWPRPAKRGSRRRKPKRR